MEKDPLSFFLNEKQAADSAPSTSVDVPKQKPFTADPDPESLDPGERAMAGLLSAGGGIVGGAIQWVANSALSSAAFSGAKDVSRHAQRVPAGKMTGMPYGKSRSKVLGLFDVESRMPKDPIGLAADEARLFRGEAAQHPLTKRVISQAKAESNIAKTVDSFIDKHNLAKKGVTMNIRHGPINLAGPRYEIATKRVYLPSISKELALHELGHAADYTKGRLGKFRGFAEPMLFRGAAIALPAALIAGDRIAELLPGTVDDRAIKFMQDNAPAIMGATIAATTLYPEGKASVLALQHIAKTEGRAAAIQSLKRLGPAWATYALGAIPAIVGMSLARKYMRAARAEKSDTSDLVAEKMRELEKTSGLFSSLNPVTFIREGVPSIAREIRSSARDIGHVGKQIAVQSRSLASQPGTAKRIGAAALNVGTDPAFAHGALNAALPAAMASLYLYGSHSGREIRQRMDAEQIRKVQTGSESGTSIGDRADDEWREKNPLLFSGLVAAGAAMSGGIMTKLFSDLARVL
jgi:hypothetical protein